MLSEAKGITKKMKIFYTDEENIQILLAVLKVHKIKKIIASPGSSNMTLVRSMQNDPYFEMYSSVDERSAAYMACGLASESCEPVVLTCTGATASRNYLPGLTEAYHRKLPILAITATKAIHNVGHLIPQVLDHSYLPKDTVKYSVNLGRVRTDEDKWDCEVKLNTAILELSRHGGGPVHINLTTVANRSYTTEKLPEVKVIRRIFQNSKDSPPIRSKVAVFIGAHKEMNEEMLIAIDQFCRTNNAVVFCDQTSAYRGKYRVLHSLSSMQRMADSVNLEPDLTIHIGEITGDYSANRIIGKQVWRVSEDGEIRDTFRKLTYVFEMPEQIFFQMYTSDSVNGDDSYFNKWKTYANDLYNDIPELPFSNIWIAQKLHNLMPENSTIHFGILNSLRSWNFFELSNTIECSSNVGGFGIDGCVSSLIGASFVNRNKLYFLVVGDLAFFYDLNSIGNRHVGSNLRILLVNNGKGTEFKHFNNPGSAFDESTDEYIAAGMHFGNQSRTVVKKFSKSLGFEYLSAEDKIEFKKTYKRFIEDKMLDKPIIFEVFTNSKDESDALEAITSIRMSTKGKTKNAIANVLGKENVKKIKKLIK